MVGAAPLRAAVVGVGRLGGFHAGIYAEHPDAELCFVVDADGERAAELADRLGCQALTDPADLPEDLDLCSVAVPTVAHAAVSVPLLERGVAVLVEKPLAPNLEEADAILEAAQRGGAPLAVGHVERFQPSVRKVRALGIEPRFIECHRLSPFSFRSLDIGVVHDLMIHDLDLILDFIDSPVAEVDAAGGAILTGSEDVASVRLVFENGARANVTASRASLGPMRRFRLFSSEGYVSLDFTGNEALVVKKGPDWESRRAELANIDPRAAAAMAPGDGDWSKGLLEITRLELEGEQRPLQAELDSFLTCVRKGVAPEVTGEDGRRALALAERIRVAIAAQTW